MGCVATKLEEEGEAVAICRERKKLLKQAVERRYALAEAHFRYCQALYAVSAAIKLFVARHSSPSSPFLITFSPATPPPESCGDATGGGTASAMLLQQKPSESKSTTTTTTTTTEAVACGSSSCGPSASESEEDEEEGSGCRALHGEDQAYGYYYMQMPPPMPSPPRDYGWDFFNLFDTMRPEVLAGYTNKSHHHHSYDDHIRTVRKQEGIPELEEEDGEEKKEVIVEEHNAVNGNGDCGEEADDRKDSGGAQVVKADVAQGEDEKRELTVVDPPEKGRDRELLDALRDIEGHFVRAYDSGKDVSRMLEANRVHLQSGLEEIKENSTKLIQAITWHRSTSFKPVSCKSLVASSSLKGSSAWTEFKNDLFEDYGGMVSGSHSLTLERLYAWEKKLYEEVKAGDGIRKLYERKCAQMRNQDVRGHNIFRTDKTRAAVKDLYARILVAIRSAESISGRIEKLRDEELQPQIIELLKGLTQTWKIMLESHETQNKILFEVGTFSCPAYGKFMNDSHRLATLQLEAEFQNWRTRLTEYVSAQKGYVHALHGWLTKFLAPEVELYSRGRGCPAPWPGQFRANGPQLLPICYEWLSSLDKLPDNSAVFALKSFARDVRAMWARQGEEQQQKRRVDRLVKELDKQALSVKKTETRYLEYKPVEETPALDGDDSHNSEYVRDKWDPLEALKRKLEAEREKHHQCVQETQRIMLCGFQTGFSSVFEAMTEFSKAAQNMYNELAKYEESTDKAVNYSCTGGSANIGDGAKR
ncbi:hypothetical protein CRG98_029662 [Punica granatum]|uniref:Nitrate regulatory gene2 protein-like n=1 Tax=Punica granatum TaxID=22663 RepID=A0A2I0J135_PUNGR|nr:hypothetical protein CRG98_029662 [Punica granatum]